MGSIDRPTNISEFPFERTADGRQRTLMGLSEKDFHQVTEIRLDSPKNVSFFTQEHWTVRLKWQRETLSGRLKRLGLKIEAMMHKPTMGQLVTIQSARDRLRFIKGS